MNDLGDGETQDHLEHLGVIVLGAKDMTMSEEGCLLLDVFHE